MGERKRAPKSSVFQALLNSYKKIITENKREKVNIRVFANEGEMNFLGREGFVAAVAQIQRGALAH